MESLPNTLSLDEAYRAAYYLVANYISVEKNPSESLLLLRQYLHSDPSRWDDWLSSVARGLADDGTASPR